MFDKLFAHYELPIDIASEGGVNLRLQQVR